jgi:predicted metalloprotease
MGFPMRSGARGGGLGLAGIALVVVIGLLMGSDPLQILGQIIGGGSGPSVGLPSPDAGVDVAAREPFQATPQEEELVDFVSFVLDDVQEFWPTKIRGYEDAKLVLFRDLTQSACGLGQAAMGPFYCPGDQKVYIDLGFYGELKQRFGAPGDFAQAYVLAHEIGHHIQKLSGIEPRVRQLQQRAPRQKNHLSVMMELQADCLAGVWGHSAAKRGILERGDIEEGLRAAAAIGDDRMQQMSGRAVQPEGFTHGSSEQRVMWLNRGLNSGNPDRCDTFQGTL